MMVETVYLNGALVPRGKASISPFDRGFLYGYGLFETMRFYGGGGRLSTRPASGAADGRL